MSGLRKVVVTPPNFDGAALDYLRAQGCEPVLPAKPEAQHSEADLRALLAGAQGWIIGILVVVAMLAAGVAIAGSGRLFVHYLGLALWLPVLPAAACCAGAAATRACAGALAGAVRPDYWFKFSPLGRAKSIAFKC